MRLPESISALLFDMDGVLTDTAAVHARAWKQTFDEVLSQLSSGDRSSFGAQADYENYVDGRSRLDGVRCFLESRQIELPEGNQDDPPDALTVHGVGARKNDLLLELFEKDGVELLPGATELVGAAHEAGLKCAVVTSSSNAHDALRAADMDEALFDAWVDGVRIDHEHLDGKPAPDTFLAAARDLEVEAGAAAVFEDALAGVKAGKTGGFGCVVGVDRRGRPEQLREHGADVVVKDLSEIELP